MVETVLLRFRDHDTNVDTIKEHRAIIGRGGYVWWGWWRKDSEPDQDRAINELSEKARRDNIEIGIFDPSTSRYFVALAGDFVLNSVSHGSPEKDKTPAYYPDKRKVYAWIKLSRIQDESYETFVSKFGGIPQSEHTFFPITRGARRAEGKLEDFIKLRSDNVLHISDIHFGTDHGFPSKGGVGGQTMIERLKRDVDAVCGGQVGLIVLSGDIGSRGDANVLLMQGLDFLNALEGELRVPKEAFLVIPGNHDFKLLEYQPTDFSHELGFNTMLRDFYGQYDPDQKFRRYAFPSGRHAEFLLINSVRLRKTEEANYGYVEWSLYENRLKARAPDKEITRIAILHHHLVSMPREEFLDEAYPHAGMSTTIDSGAVIEGLQGHSFRLALHGHQHVPGIARISRGVIDGRNEATEPKELEILSAGSAGAKVERLSNLMRDNSYNLLRFERDEIQIESRRYNSGADGSRYFVTRVPY